MPPIFGIISREMKPVNKSLFNSMEVNASYVIPRFIKSVDLGYAYFGNAIVEDMTDSASVLGFFQHENLCIIADANLFNRTEIIERLGLISSPESFPDSALILNSFIKWNRKCVEYFTGDFAFIIIDKNTGEIFAGRDRLGIRPFFYYCNEEYFYFGSELRFFKKAVKLKDRTEYLFETLLTKKAKKHLTAFQDVYRLLPAHFLVVNSSHIEAQQYWDLNIKTELRFKTENEYIEFFREKLLKAVGHRISGGGLLGLELSGGLDSSSITGIAAKANLNNAQRLKAYSNIFPEDSGINFKDEREFIDEMIVFSGIDWKGIDHLNKAIPDLLEDALNIQGCNIQQNFSIFNIGLYEAMAIDGIKVLLSGFGGDELVSATMAFPWNEMIRKGHWGHIFNEIYGKGLTLRNILKPVAILLRYVKSLVNCSPNRSGAFTTDLLDRRFANLPLQEDYKLKYSLHKEFVKMYRKPKRATVSMMQYDRIMMDHVTQRIEYCYASAAQYGIECRYPLLDVDLVQTAISMPAWLKQRQGISRYLFRMAIDGFVPDRIRLRNDKSGNPIPHKFFRLVKDRNEIIDLIKRSLTLPYLREIFDLEKFLSWYDKLVKRAPEDQNYLMPGAFYTYLMILLYYKDKGE